MKDEKTPKTAPRTETGKKPAEYVSVTYGVKGLMDWKVKIRTGFAKHPYLDLHFTGGQMTGYGIAPARYTTSDPVEREIIEKSQLFKTGRIFRMSR